MRRLPMATMVALILIGCASLVAHEITVMGTVAKVEATRLQVRTGNENAGSELTWYPIDEQTTIKRGTRIVTFAEAKITVDERVVLLVDHPASGPIKTREIRLSAR